MNDRIRELIEQTTKHYPATESSGEFSTFDKEKFAELIVQECLGVLKSYNVKCAITTFDLSMVECARMRLIQGIEEHFKK